VITAIISLISGLFSVAGKIFELLYSKQLIDAGKTAQQLEDLKGQINAAQEAIAIREAQRLINERDGVPINGEWDRDK
jgi:hypothetical protein